MKKILFILIVLVLITGCASTSQLSGREEGRGGVPDGLTIEFLSPSGNEVREDIFFPVKLKLENNAECIVDGTICIRDTAGSSLSGIVDDCENFNIQKLDKKVPYFTFENNVYENLERDIDTTILAKAIYECNININPFVCVRQDDDKLKDSCPDIQTISGKVGGLKTAPVTVTTIKKKFDASGGLLSLQIYLDEMDKKDGRVVSNNYVKDNNEYGFPISISFGELDVMNDCYTYSDNLKNGIYYWKKDTENIINCEILVSGINEFEDIAVNINLDYTYELEKSKDIKVRYKYSEDV
ncbi:MAG: hypothetical protein KJ674_00895 [Nanoarchaeota archaeon]|nr:hypothetical protein [Nanoarchaeota archaeon]